MYISLYISIYPNEGFMNSGVYWAPPPVPVLVGRLQEQLLVGRSPQEKGLRDHAPDVPESLRVASRQSCARLEKGMVW